MTLSLLPLHPESQASADELCSSVASSFVPSLPKLAAVPNPHHQESQLPPGPTRAQQGTQALPSSAGEPPLRSHEQMGITEPFSDTEPAGFAQTYAASQHQQPVCGALLVMHGMEDLWM